MTGGSDEKAALHLRDHCSHIEKQAKITHKHQSAHPDKQKLVVRESAPPLRVEEEMHSYALQIREVKHAHSTDGT